eukprot:scaffold1014_cov21-Tisochrysis_lutea.AAC.1
MRGFTQYHRLGLTGNKPCSLNAPGPCSVAPKPSIAEPSTRNKEPTPARVFSRAPDAGLEEQV